MQALRRRVVVTGIGVESVAGASCESLWQTVTNGTRTLARALEGDEFRGLSTTFAASMPDFEPRELDPRLARRIDRSTQMGLTAALRAYTDAGGDALPKDRVGIAAGTAIGPLSSLVANAQLCLTTPRHVRPYAVPMVLPSATAAEAALLLGCTGPTMSPTPACAAGAQAIGEAFRAIRYGDADAMLCGGTEAGIHPVTVVAFSRMGALSRRNEEPERASRPFDDQRDGFVLGEGAAFLVLESLESALARGGRIHAEVLGYAANNDAYHVAAPSPQGDGAARCMELALADAGVSPAQVVQVNAHGTSTRLNDDAEVLAIRRVFGERTVPLTATKGVTGHLLGASGALEAVVALLSATTGIVPPVANLERPDESMPPDLVCASARRVPAGVVLSNSFGFGGHNSVLAVAPYWPDGPAAAGAAGR